MKSCAVFATSGKPWQHWTTPASLKLLDGGSTEEGLPYLIM